MDLPLVTYSGFLKQIDAEKLGTCERAALRASLPHFWSAVSGEENFVRQRARDHLGDVVDDPTRFVFTRQTVPNRRFSGGQDLPGQRYYTLSQDALGSDSLTLQSEMRAYRSVKRSALCTVVDTRYPLSQTLTDALSVCEADRQSMLLVFWGGPELHNPFLDELDRTFKGKNMRPLDGDQRQSQCAAFVAIPYRVLEAEIPCVFDLRLLDAQEWLFQMVCVEKGHCEVFVRFDDDPHADFVDLLPWLMTMEVGGGGLTEGVGRFLRRNGAQALIYPSARNDAFAVQANRALVKSAGWCLVDYRDAPVPPDIALLDLCDQTPFPFGGGTRVVEFPDGITNGSWATDGIRELYRYRFCKELQDCVGVEKSLPLIDSMLSFEGNSIDVDRFRRQYQGRYGIHL